MTISDSQVTTTKCIAVATHGPLARITLAHPPLNVIDFQMMDELLAALQQLEQRKEISAVIINGAGRGFSPGVDVAVHTPELIQAMLQKFHGVILAAGEVSQDYDCRSSRRLSGRRRGVGHGL